MVRTRAIGPRSWMAKALGRIGVNGATNRPLVASESVLQEKPCQSLFSF